LVGLLIFLCGEWHPTLLWPNGWMDEDATWYGSRHRRRPHCIRRLSSAPRKGHSNPPRLLGPCLLWPRSPISATAELLFLEHSVVSGQQTEQCYTTFGWNLKKAFLRYIIGERTRPITQGYAYLLYPLYPFKYSSVTEMSDCLATIDMGRK